MSIREHIKSAMQGDVRSFEYLVNNFQAYTINYAYGILGDYHLAEDAAQEAFILLYGNIGNLKEPSAFLSWLNRLTFTCCGRITRKKKLDTNNGFEGLRSAENPAGAIETEERLSLIRYSLNDLTEVQREAITLYYFMDKSYSDIGELLGISEAAVKNRLYAGKKRLRDILPKTMKEYVEEIMSNREQFTRKILEQVPNITTQDPKIHENFQFCGCMRAVMQYLKKDPEYDFIYFAGVSGALFSNVWSYNPIWQYTESTAAFKQFDGWEEIIQSVFRIIGYECEIVLEDEIQKNQKKYLKKIIESLNKGYPVLTYGIFGPPTCSLITGYDENGEILIGWSAFQDGEHGIPDGYEPCGYFRKRNGLDESRGLIFFGNETESITKKEKAIIALKNIRRVMHLKKTGNLAFGTDAFRLWAEALLNDDYFKENSGKLDVYAEVHCGMKTIVMTGSWYMDQFLVIMKEYDPENSNLYDNMLALREKENNVLLKFWEVQPEFHFDKEKLLDRNYRIQLAGIISDAGDIYQQIKELL